MIRGVINPVSQGGVGLFKVRTSNGGSNNILDQNLVLGTIGLAPAYNQLGSVSLDYASSAKAGTSSELVLKFQITSYMPAGSWFMFEIPTDYYSFSNPNVYADD